MKHKVFAYITRMKKGQQQLLVYTQRNRPEAGLQVPGGTVEPGEREEDALYREIEEESGLVHFKFIGKLGQTSHRRTLRRETWHFFQVESLETPANRWKHTVQSFGKDDGHVFDFFWMPVEDAAKRLAEGQAECLDLLYEPIPGKASPEEKTSLNEAKLRSRYAE